MRYHCASKPAYTKHYFISSSIALHRIKRRGAEYWKEKAQNIAEGANIGGFLVRSTQLLRVVHVVVVFYDISRGLRLQHPFNTVL